MTSTALISMDTQNAFLPAATASQRHITALMCVIELSKESGGRALLFIRYFLKNVKRLVRHVLRVSWYGRKIATQIQNPVFLLYIQMKLYGWETER